MSGFIIRTKDNLELRFNCYEAAPATSAAFIQSLPFSELFYHARISGQEIWMDKAPSLHIPQENVSVFAEPGEIVIGPQAPSRNKIVGCMGILYGEGKLLDGGNIFGKIWPEDAELLTQLGNRIWKQGAEVLKFEIMPTD